ncbi:MAG: hypothetical protein ACRDKL_11150, partial [Solirubrobacteraceae bacterium]
YDLASVLLGGPYGPQLRGAAFKRARAYVIDAFGELDPSPPAPRSAASATAAAIRNQPQAGANRR